MKAIYLAMAVAVGVIGTAAAAPSNAAKRDIRECEQRGPLFVYELERKRCIKSDPIWKLQPDSGRDSSGGGRNGGGSRGRS